MSWNSDPLGILMKEASLVSVRQEALDFLHYQDDKEWLFVFRGEQCIGWNIGDEHSVGLPWYLDNADLSDCCMMHNHPGHHINAYSLCFSVYDIIASSHTNVYEQIVVSTKKRYYSRLVRPKGGWPHHKNVSMTFQLTHKRGFKLFQKYGLFATYHRF